MKKGDRAPGFSLQDTEGKFVSLSELTSEGTCLLLFFPLAFSGVCTDEMCVVRDNMKLYNSLNTKVAGISVDSFFTLSEFKKANNINFLLLSDFNKITSKDYNCLYQDFFGMKGVSKRGAFVIDANHIIQYAEILDDSDHIPDFKSIIKALNN